MKAGRRKISAGRRRIAQSSTGMRLTPTFTNPRVTTMRAGTHGVATQTALAVSSNSTNASTPIWRAGVLGVAAQIAAQIVPGIGTDTRVHGKRRAGGHRVPMDAAGLLRTGEAARTHGKTGLADGATLPALQAGGGIATSSLIGGGIATSSRIGECLHTRRCMQVYSIIRCISGAARVWDINVIVMHDSHDLRFFIQ